MRHERIIGMALVGLTLAGRTQAAEAEELTLEALPLSAGAVELRWNVEVDSTIERKAAGDEFEPIRRTGTRGENPFRAYVDTELLPDTEYTYRLAIPTGWHYDFGPKAHRPAPDHVRVSGSDVFTEAGGFGFEKATPDGTMGPAGRRPREHTFAVQGTKFIKRLPNGHYLLRAGGVGVEQLVINGEEVKTEGLGYSNIRAISNVPVEVTDGKLVIEPRRGRGFGWLNIVPAEGDPVRTLATATVRTHSIAQMVGIMRDDKKPLADRLVALYSLGDMAEAAAPAAPAVAEILMETEQDNEEMHRMALWSLGKIGPEHVSDPAQRAAAEKLLAGLDDHEPNIELWLALARDIPAGIRQHRMGTLAIKTTPGAKVTVNQSEHEFGFGAAIASSIFDERARRRPAEEDRERYLSILKDNFNSAVHENALKWRATEAGKDVYTYETADAILAWCEANGLRMRGHTIFWAKEQFVPNWQKGLDDAELRAKLEQRARDVMTRYKGRISEYDVNNEMVDGRFYANRLGETIRHDMFRWCREADPDAVLYVNDYVGWKSGMRPDSRYENQITELLAAGVPVGGIGKQAHTGGRVNPVAWYNRIDSYAKFNLPIKITELSINETNEDIKAMSLVDMYTAGFSHPAVDGILLWGFWEGDIWKKHAYLWKRDWTPTKAAEAYRYLVYEKWWTRYEGKADAQGMCEVPVFFGRHRVAVDGKPAQDIFLGRKDGKKTVDMTAP